MSASGWRSLRLDEIERSGQRDEWIPIRRHIGVRSFGVNAWSGDAGSELIGEHDEVPSGHEELYLVLSGRAAFTVDGSEVDAGPGTVVFVADPALKRRGVAQEDGTTILSMGAKPGEAYVVRSWEVNSELLPLFERGEYQEIKRRLHEALEGETERAGLLYNLACAESRLGETDAAVEHLREAVELEARFAEFAQTDDDLEAIRSDPRFPSA